MKGEYINLMKIKIRYYEKDIFLKLQFEIDDENIETLFNNSAN